MNFVSDLISKVLLGSVLGALLAAWFASRRGKRDLCIQVYERWISNPLYQSRNEALRQLRAFFDRSPAAGYEWSDVKVKLSDLNYLSQKHPDYESSIFSEDFTDNFIQVLIFLADLNKLMKQELVDVQLARAIFKDTILPWYKYLDKLELDMMEEVGYSFIALEINSLKRMLCDSHLNEVSLLHLKYVLLKKAYDELKQEVRTK